jgi:hypothetical protein
VEEIEPPSALLSNSSAPSALKLKVLTQRAQRN